MAGKIQDKWPFPVDGRLGVHAEEVKLLQQLEKNPSASPMPEVAPTKLLTPDQSSEALRLTGSGNPEELDGPSLEVLTHVVLRNLRIKRNQRGWQRFVRALESGALNAFQPKRVDQVQSMGRREERMLDLLLSGNKSYNVMAEEVYAKILSQQPG